MSFSVPEPEVAILGAHQCQLHSDQSDAPDDGLALKQRPRREIDIGFGRLGDETVLGVEHARAQNNQIDATLIARPFDGRLVILDRDARERLSDRARKRVAERPERNRANQQPDHGADHEKDDSSADPARNKRRMADVMGLDVLTKEQIPLPGS